MAVMLTVHYQQNRTANLQKKWKDVEILELVAKADTSSPCLCREEVTHGTAIRYHNMSFLMYMYPDS